jgi:hypothetical protein
MEMGRQLEALSGEDALGAGFASFLTALALALILYAAMVLLLMVRGVKHPPDVGAAPCLRSC